MALSFGAMPMQIKLFAIQTMFHTELYKSAQIAASGTTAAPQ